MYDNNFETKENEIYTKYEIEAQHIHSWGRIQCLSELSI